MMSNIEIIKTCAIRKIPLVGVYSKDKLPSNIRSGNYIVNMQDDEDGNGTHWVSFIKGEGMQPSFYFDSYGVTAPTSIADALRMYDYNKRDIQSMESKACGLYCISFLEAMREPTKANFDKFVNSWSWIQKKNDLVLCAKLQM
jgi:hypothetical protein